ncbi:beta-ketoacyl-ACP synthase II [Longimicrobium terrae]|uniref:3-oxoacyl-[acyl-carrier-protein] synthase 2 n=1 Tax=Longimicrobium terrae TaxID=1639882 RepID=A0A841H1G0_9BACT|nr:3-oxoacyl-[acyl-carrier-protein] synthase II [Longimicrobium terrae]MBB6071833.1 3-oxoacyl-[acyl-carrier-protein] synthase II [Longimicrobium terrae]NNC30382.1 beta-ketoacyl-ACP synthase II [Longimicrobium terrae]
MQQRRVVITGVGLVSALGNTAAETWAGVKAGRSGIGPLTRCELPGLAPEIAIAGEVKNFSPEPVLDRKDARRMDWFIQYALVAAHDAMVNAGLGGLGPVPDPTETGTIVGSGMGGLISIMETADTAREKGTLSRVSPFFIPASIINLAAGQIAIRTGAQGPSYAPVSACASSNHAIGEAFHAIQRGDAKMMLAGGTEACLTPISFGGFAAARALATQWETPETASRPFDATRSGFVHAEGGGILVMEELESARERGAPILAEVIGFGMSADAYHITAPPENGEGAALAMKRGLRSAGIAPERVDYINAHGTSTPVGDRAETRAIRSVFGAHADRLAVSSTKSMIGHALGGSASIEAAVCAMALNEGIMPPTINLRNPDPECDLDYVPDTAREAALDVVISNSFGFGGANTTLVLKRFE